MLNRMLILTLAISLTACSSVTVRTDQQNKESQRLADYQQRFNFYFWGLKGEHSVNVREVCQARKVEQIQSVFTLSDTALTIVTLGIYAPRSARIWCQQDMQTQQQGSL